MLYPARPRCLFNELVEDKRVLAVGGRYGGLAPCPHTHPRPNIATLTRRQYVFGIVKAGGTGADMPPQCMSAATPVA